MRGPLSAALGAGLTIQGTYTDQRGGGTVARITYQMGFAPSGAGAKIDQALRTLGVTQTSVLDMPSGTVVTYQGLSLGYTTVSGSVSQQEKTLTVVAQMG